MVFTFFFRRLAAPVIFGLQAILVTPLVLGTFFFVVMLLMPPLLGTELLLGMLLLLPVLGILEVMTTVFVVGEELFPLVVPSVRGAIVTFISLSLLLLALPLLSMCILLFVLRCSLEERLRREWDTFSLAYSSETSYHNFVLGSNKTNL